MYTGFFSATVNTSCHFFSPCLESIEECKPISIYLYIFCMGKRESRAFPFLRGNNYVYIGIKKYYKLIFLILSSKIQFLYLVCDQRRKRFWMPLFNKRVIFRFGHYTCVWENTERNQNVGYIDVLRTMWMSYICNS